MGGERPCGDGQALQGCAGVSRVLERRDEGRRDGLGRYAGAGRDGLDRVHVERAGERGQTYPGGHESYCIGTAGRADRRKGVGSEGNKAGGATKDWTGREVAAEPVRSGRYAGGVDGVCAGRETVLRRVYGTPSEKAVIPGEGSKSKTKARTAKSAKANVWQTG